MAIPDTGPIPRWIYSRLRVLFEPGPGAPSDDPPRRRGAVITLCFLASILLWFTFAIRESYTRIMEFPTEVRNLADEEALSDLPPSSVRAQVEGEGIQLLRLYYDPPVIPIDATQETVDLGVLAPDVVNSVRLESVTPQSVRIFKELRTTKRVAVEPRVAIATSPGHHMVGSLGLDPDSITVSGASSILATLQAWPTRTMRLQAADDTLVAQVELSDTLNGLLSRTVDRVEVRGTVRQFTEGTRTLQVLITGAPPGQRVSLEPRSVTVRFQVSIDAYDLAMSTEDLWAEVPYSDVRTDTTGSVRPAVRLPGGIVFRGLRVTPASLNYYDVLDPN